MARTQVRSNLKNKKSMGQISSCLAGLESVFIKHLEQRPAKGRVISIC